MSIFNISSGHNPDGKTACGAIGLIKESTEARKVKDKVIELLRKDGHIVYDCTVENGTSQNNVLSKIVAKCNSHKVDLDISIHFNSGRNDYNGDKSTGGTEVFVYNANSKAKDEATRICHKISALGFRNRGVKYSTRLYFLRKTASPSMLIECCFVDDADDVKIYNADKMAKAIVEGLLGKTVSATTTSPTPSNTTVSGTKYISGGFDYSPVFDPTFYANKYADLKGAFGTNVTKLFDHFIVNGMKEGRQAISTFNVQAYKNRYSDLQKAFGNNLPAYYEHYITNGHKEGRKAT